MIDKPAGMVVHPGGRARARHAGERAAPSRRRISAASAARERPGIVHRLDRGTSGVMVIAKTRPRASRAVAAVPRSRRSSRNTSRSSGDASARATIIDRPIGRDPRHRQKMSSRARTRARGAHDGPRGRAARRRVARAPRHRHRPHAPDSRAPQPRRAIRSSAMRSTAACGGVFRRAVGRRAARAPVPARGAAELRASADGPANVIRSAASRGSGASDRRLCDDRRHDGSEAAHGDASSHQTHHPLSRTNLPGRTGHRAAQHRTDRGVRYRAPSRIRRADRRSLRLDPSCSSVSSGM